MHVNLLAITLPGQCDHIYLVKPLDPNPNPNPNPKPLTLITHACQLVITLSGQCDHMHNHYNDDVRFTTPGASDRYS